MADVHRPDEGEPPRTLTISLPWRRLHSGWAHRYRYVRRVAPETYSRHLIRIARRKAGLTQKALADRAGTSQAAMSAYESGKRSPSVETLCRILRAAGFEVRMRLAAPDSHEPALRLALSQLVFAPEATRTCCAVRRRPRPLTSTHDGAYGGRRGY